jgi:AcrR family transcriptional regulator
MTLEPEPPLRKYHHGGLAEVLVQACQSIIVEKGLTGLTLREIARRAQVSHAAPKHHFASLGDLLGEVAARGFEDFTKALSSAAEKVSPQSPGERLEAMGRAYLRFAESNPALYGLMFGQSGECAMTRHLINASHAAWELLEVAAAALVGPRRSVTAAVSVWSMVHGYAMLKREHRMPPHAITHSDEADMLRRLTTGLVAKEAP